MRRGNLVMLTLIALLTIASGWVVWPQQPSNYIPFLSLPGSNGVHIKLGESSFDRQGMRLGLDLQGGTLLVLQADLSKVATDDRANAMKGVQDVIGRRIDAYGVAEPQIQLQGDDRVMVQLPGVKDVQEAVRLIGKTAQLDFREQALGDDGQPTWKIAIATATDGQQYELTGKYLKPNSQVVFEPNSTRPQVRFEWDADGARMFEEVTTRLVGKPLGIFLDNQPISAPTVQSVIRDNGVITGLTLNDARLLAIQLNAGALPVPVSIIKQSDVDATLGADSIRKSIVAGEIALLIVILFMIVHYRLPGLLAAGALIIYTLMSLALFKLIPVTLTLAGIAAFILSLGMAVDANILIFERMHEELRAGKSFAAAIQAGFGRAWTSIRDSNISTMITCAILYWFGSNFGASIVMGFALTLFLGVVVSMFTAITITRTFINALVGHSVVNNPTLIGVERITVPALGRPGSSALRLDKRPSGNS